MKNRYVAAILAFFLGGLGVHKFYLGKWTGIFYLVLCWTYIPSVVALIEGILYLTSSDEVFNEKYNKKKCDKIINQNNQGIVSNNISTLNDTYSLVCPKCGHVNEVDSNFCEECGQKL